MTGLGWPWGWRTYLCNCTRKSAAHHPLHGRDAVAVMHHKLLDAIIERELDCGLWCNLDHVGAIASEERSERACTRPQLQLKGDRSTQTA